MQPLSSRIASSWRVFQSCLIMARLPRHGQANVVTAQARQIANSSIGFMFQFCNITGDPLLRVKECFIDDTVHPSIYLTWDGFSAGLDTLFYGEYNDTGLGSHISGRVKLATSQWQTLFKVGVGCQAQVLSSLLAYDSKREVHLDTII
ncbi:hypothetical protein EJB05_55798, partial [Eragrostis curvula]